MSELPIDEHNVHEQINKWAVDAPNTWRIRVGDASFEVDDKTFYQELLL